MRSCARVGLSFGNVKLLADTEPLSATEHRYGVRHGDIFDPATRYPRALAALGVPGHEVMVRVQTLLTAGRRLVGRRAHRSLVTCRKNNRANVPRFISDFEHAAAGGYAGLLCGHLHLPAGHHIEVVHYLNCGDWVDSCAALLAHFDGRFALITPATGR